MDYKKIGELILNERKAKKLTQADLAEKLFVSEKTISKWENGRGIPDTNSLSKMCKVFDITINELLNGERIATENYKPSAEAKLIELSKQNELKNKKVYFSTCILTIAMVIFYFSFIFLASFTLGETVISSIIILVSTIVLVIALYFTFKIEIDLSNYECKHCHHKFTPSYKQAFFAQHIGTTRHLKCPKCNKKSWAKRSTSK